MRLQFRSSARLPAPWENCFFEGMENIFHCPSLLYDVSYIFFIFNVITGMPSGPGLASYNGNRGIDLMKMLSQLVIAGVVMVTPLFAQEPKRAVVPQETIAETKISTDQTVATGLPQRRAPEVLPKALPPMNPTLGEIARRARAAHAEAPKAQMVVADDALPQDKGIATADSQPAENSNAAASARN